MAKKKTARKAASKKVARKPARNSRIKVDPDLEHREAALVRAAAILAEHFEVAAVVVQGRTLAKNRSFPRIYSATASDQAAIGLVLTAADLGQTQEDAEAQDLEEI